MHLLLQFFREHFGEADCSSAGAVNAYMPRCVHTLHYAVQMLKFSVCTVHVYGTLNVTYYSTSF